MNASLIPYYLQIRMQEMGFCDGFTLRVKHYALAPLQTLRIAAFSQFFILMDQGGDVRVESDLGVFDPTDPNTTNEQQHEHTGQISLINLSSDCSCGVQFIQAIPLESSEAGCTCKNKSHGNCQ